MPSHTGSNASVNDFASERIGPGYRLLCTDKLGSIFDPARLAFLSPCRARRTHCQKGSMQTTMLVLLPAAARTRIVAADFVEAMVPGELTRIHRTVS